VDEVSIVPRDDVGIVPYKFYETFRVPCRGDHRSSAGVRRTPLRYISKPSDYIVGGGAFDAPWTVREAGPYEFLRSLSCAS